MQVAFLIKGRLVFLLVTDLYIIKNPALDGTLYAYGYFNTLVGYYPHASGLVTECFFLFGHVFGMGDLLSFRRHF